MVTDSDIFRRKSADLPKLKADTEELVGDGFHSISEEHVATLIQRINNDDPLFGSILIRLRERGMTHPELTQLSDVLCGMLYTYLLLEAASQQE